MRIARGQQSEYAAWADCAMLRHDIVNTYAGVCLGVCVRIGAAIEEAAMKHTLCTYISPSTSDAGTVCQGNGLRRAGTRIRSPTGMPQANASADLLHGDT